MAGYLALAPAPAPVLAAQPARDGAGAAALAAAGGLAAAPCGRPARWVDVRHDVAVGAVGVDPARRGADGTAQASPAASTDPRPVARRASRTDQLPARDFTLTDQHGGQVTLSSLRGKAVLLTFLDPVCVTDCPLIAQEFRQAGQLLGVHSPHVDWSR